jgi:hypothetical protein
VATPSRWLGSGPDSVLGSGVAPPRSARAAGRAVARSDDCTVRPPESDGRPGEREIELSVLRYPEQHPSGLVPLHPHGDVELHAVDKWRRVVDTRNHDPNNNDRTGNSSCELRQPGLNKSRYAGSEAGSDRGLALP